MAAGEFVSVHSQADTENADLNRERAELKENPEGEQRELASIYVARGLDAALADEVAGQLMAHDALGAHDATSWGSARSPQRGPCRQRSPRPQALRPALRCRSGWSSRHPRST